MRVKRRQPPQNPRWTEEEDAILRSRYGFFGANGVVDTLRRQGHFPRTREAVMARAKRLKVEFTGGKGFMALVDAYPRGRGTQAHPDIVAAAEQDGVLRRSPVYPHVHQAPVWWVDRFMEHMDQELAQDLEVSRSWLKTAEVARLFGLTPRSFAVIIAPSNPKGYILREHTARIPQHVTNRRMLGMERFGRFWRPEEAHREAERYAMRQKVRRAMRTNRRRRAA